MLQGATVGQGGRKSLLCTSRLTGVTPPSGVLTRSNLSPHSPLPLPASTYSFFLPNGILTQSSFMSLLFPPPPLPPLTGGIRDGDIRQGSEPVLWGEVAGDLPRPKLSWNSWTRISARKRKGGRQYRRLRGRLHTAPTQTVENGWESGPHQVRPSSRRKWEKWKTAFLISHTSLWRKETQKTDERFCKRSLVYFILGFWKNYSQLH